MMNAMPTLTDRRSQKDRGFLVYRVQDREGRGPWRPGFSQFWVIDRFDHANLRPWMDDFGDEVVDAVKASRSLRIGCGCATIDQLQRWFTHDEYATLKWFGYSAVMIVADRIVAQNDRQLVFQRKIPLSKGAVEFDLY